MSQNRPDGLVSRPAPAAQPPSAAAISAWLGPAMQRIAQPPAVPRERLWLQGHEIGSVQADFWPSLPAQALAQQGIQLHHSAQGWQLSGQAPGLSASALLNTLAQVMHRSGHCGPWRDEQLAVCNPLGQQVATIERGAVRPLGIATRAVHLVGCNGQGLLWLQQRAHSKATHPGKWDTLMGGMVSATDTVAEAVERETWEEAGLRMAELQQARHGGCIEFACPSNEAEGRGYMRERIDWFVATVPEHLQPDNRDGEVQAFALLPPAQVQQWVLQDRFTPEAALVLAHFFDW